MRVNSLLRRYAMKRTAEIDDGGRGAMSFTATPRAPSGSVGNGRPRRWKSASRRPNTGKRRPADRWPGASICSGSSPNGSSPSAGSGVRPSRWSSSLPRASGSTSNRAVPPSCCRVSPHAQHKCESVLGHCSQRASGQPAFRLQDAKCFGFPILKSLTTTEATTMAKTLLPHPSR